MEAHADFPLTFHASVAPDALAACGLTPTGRVAANRSRASILAAAIEAHDAFPGGWTSYSRRKAWYAPLSRYFDTDYTYANVVHGVDDLVVRGLLEHMKASRGDHRKARPWDPSNFGVQSRFRATPKLLCLVEDTWLERRAERFEPIRMTNADGHLVGYRDTGLTDELRRDVESINEHLGSFGVSLRHPDLHDTGRHWIVRRPDGKAPVIVRPTGIRTYRVFGRENFDIGGRFYGWWQTLPKEVRDSFLIDGEETAEPDISSLHPTLCYALRGLSVDHDPYDLGDRCTRKEAKLALNVAINARSIHSAVSALTRKETWVRSYQYTAEIIEALRERNAPIADDFGSDRGVHLMAIDAKIAREVLHECKREQIPVMPVHDSFRVRRRDDEHVADMMARAVSKFTGTTSTVIRTSVLNDPHMPGGRPAPARPCPSAPLSLAPFPVPVDNGSLGKPVRAVAVVKGPDLPVPSSDTPPDRLPGLDGLYRWLDAELPPAAAKERIRLTAMVRTPTPGADPTAGWDEYALGLLAHLWISKRGQAVWLKTIRETGRTATGQPLDPDTVHPRKLRLVSSSPPPTEPRKTLMQPPRRTFPARLPPRVSTAPAPPPTASQPPSSGLTHDQAVAELKARWPGLRPEDVSVTTVPRRLVAG